MYDEECRHRFSGEIALALKFLLRGVDLAIFSKSPPRDHEFSFRERILLSSFFRKMFPRQLANLEYCVNTLPFIDRSNILGRIDICREIEENSIFIRGWLFNPDATIKRLTIIYNRNRYPILAFNLSRLDVFDQLDFLPNSLYCGFVGILEGCHLSSDHVKFGFEAVTEHFIYAGTFENPII